MCHKRMDTQNSTSHFCASDIDENRFPYTRAVGVQGRNTIPQKNRNAKPLLNAYFRSQKRQKVTFTRPLQKSNSNTPRLGEQISSRPQLLADYSIPSPTQYSPRPDPPMMTSSPAFTFRSKTKVDTGTCNHVWIKNSDRKVEENFPSPSKYNIEATICSDHSLYQHSPAHSLGRKQQVSFVRKGVVDFPAPNAYLPEKLNKAITINRLPKHLMGTSLQGSKQWIHPACTPGPGSYDKASSFTAKPKAVTYSFARSPRRFDYQRVLYCS